ncbi:Fanconi anemia group C protein [Tachyglossus aculeatus]|uniref:Fanconi anemia group C protein n=1 Tax=Tachyglossus aculeatus TaxID=9261 RepID=UPI0018F7599C|nr:Fanconi anemia group C protein [Tachyglossus aculeatus]
MVGWMCCVQAEARSLQGCLSLLAGRPSVTVRQLQAAMTAGPREGGPRPRGTQQVARHLLLSFLLLTPAGRTVAREAITQMARSKEAAREVFGLLARMAYRADSLGPEAGPLARELLQSLRPML